MRLPWPATPACCTRPSSSCTRRLPDNDAFLARFASAVDQFAEPAGWWARLTGLRGRDEQPFDLKKLGTFPIVHGVRSLALQSHVGALGTAERAARAGRCARSWTPTWRAT